MTTVSSPNRTGSSLYFAFTGFLTAIVLAGAIRSDATSHSPDKLSLLPELIFIGTGSIAFIFVSAFMGRIIRRFSIPRFVYDAPLLLWIGALLWMSWHLIHEEHNRFVIVVAFAQTLIFGRSVFKPTRFWRLITLFTLSMISWAYCANLTFTPLKDLLADASPGSALGAISLLIAFAIVLRALTDDVDGDLLSRKSSIAYVFAGVIFLAASLRVDHLTSDFVPYHRSYFADVANLMRDGHWLLWDLPSQYGFLSIITLALLPTDNAWQSVFVLTSIFLTFQSIVTFAILFRGRKSISSFLFALLLPLATYFCGSVTRYPFDARLYPQLGLRFVWIVALIAIAFLQYVKRADARSVRFLTAAGYMVWAIAVLWSFETAVWATIVWMGNVSTYTIVEAFLSGEARWSRRSIIIACRFIPFIAIACVIFIALESFYRIRLGHSPDYLAFIEFSAVYAADPSYHIIVNRYGPAWSILLILGALGAVAAVAVKKGRFDSLPLIVTAWFAAWASTSYWVAEAFDNHVIAVYGVGIPSAAVVIYLSRDYMSSSVAAIFARLSLAPIAILLITLLFGEPARAEKIEAPLMPGWTVDSISAFRPISGELAHLVDRAGISLNDRVVFPTGIAWTKLDAGFILPFARLPNGKLQEYHSWLPLGPQGAYNTFESLDFDRRQTYINRNLDRFSGKAWLVTYREGGGCRLISPRMHTVRTVASPNFTASLCALSEHSAL